MLRLAPSTCPTCGREAPRPEGPAKRGAAFPFCSPACKLVDLGRWLDGAYRVAAADDDGAPGATARGEDE